MVTRVLAEVAQTDAAARPTGYFQRQPVDQRARVVDGGIVDEDRLGQQEGAPCSNHSRRSSSSAAVRAYQVVPHRNRPGTATLIMVVPGRGVSDMFADL